MDVIIKKISAIAILLILGSTYACTEDFYDEEVDCQSYNYNDCNTLEPIDANIDLLFTIKGNQSVPFEIIEGKIEDGKTIIYDTARTSKITYILTIPYYYTVKAEYKIGEKTVYAVDGVDMKAKSTHRCDSICWETPSFKLDLTLQ